jgi:hypothetical protein
VTRYAVAGIAGAAGANPIPVAVLWNPATSTRSLYIVSSIVSTSEAAGGAVFTTMRRVSSRGTPGSTVTPDADNAFDRSAAPPSGALLDLATYSVTPTTPTPNTDLVYNTFDKRGGDIIEVRWKGRGLRVPVGTGMSWCLNPSGAANAWQITFVWDES